MPGRCHPTLAVPAHGPGTPSSLCCPPALTTPSPSPGTWLLLDSSLCLGCSLFLLSLSSVPHPLTSPTCVTSSKKSSLPFNPSPSWFDQSPLLGSAACKCPSAHPVSPPSWGGDPTRPGTSPAGLWRLCQEVLMEIWAGPVDTGGCCGPELQSSCPLPGACQDGNRAWNTSSCLSSPKPLGLPLSAPPPLWLSNPGGPGAGLLSGDGGPHPQHTYPATCPVYSSVPVLQSLPG